MNPSSPGDSTPEGALLRCPLCDSELHRISLVCPHCRGEIEGSIRSALPAIQGSKSHEPIAPLSEEARAQWYKNNRDLNRATVVVILSLALTWFFVYVLTA